MHKNAQQLHIHNGTTQNDIFLAQDGPCNYNDDTGDELGFQTLDILHK